MVDSPVCCADTSVFSGDTTLVDAPLGNVVISDVSSIDTAVVVVSSVGNTLVVVSSVDGVVVVVVSFDVVAVVVSSADGVPMVVVASSCDGTFVVVLSLSVAVVVVSVGSFVSSDGSVTTTCVVSNRSSVVSMVVDCVDSVDVCVVDSDVVTSAGFVVVKRDAASGISTR